MANRVEFDKLEDANQVRQRISQHLAASDDRRTRTVVLQGDTPEQIVERVEREADASRREEHGGAGMQELTTEERESLKRQHSTFSWQKHGFEAMRVKAAARRSGVAGSDWIDLYEPGEGPASAIQKLEQQKQREAAGRGTTAVETGRRTDEEELGGRGRRARQAERASAEQVSRAKPSAFRGDGEFQLGSVCLH